MVGWLGWGKHPLQTSGHSAEWRRALHCVLKQTGGDQTGRSVAELRERERSRRGKRSKMGQREKKRGGEWAKAGTGGVTSSGEVDLVDWRNGGTKASEYWWC